MNPFEYACWYTGSFLSLCVAAVFFSISQFTELQFGNSKLAFTIFIVILVIGFSSFVNKAEFIRTKMDVVSTYRFHWIVKAIVEFSILLFVTMLIVLMKHPHFTVSDKQEDGSISAIRAYCQNPNCPDPQIKAICSNLLEEQNSKQGDQMGFLSAVAFSLHIFSTSMLLKLREEYGIFYMCLELTMNAAVEIPGIGGSILNWYYVGPTALYCFLLIIVRCYYHSSESDEVRRRGGNGDDHHDNNDAVGHTAVRVESQPTIGFEVELQPTTGVGAEGGGGGGREMGDQGHRTYLGSAAGSGWEIVSAEEGDEHKADERDEVKSSGEIERISSTSNVHLGKEITKTTQAVPVQRSLLNDFILSFVPIVVSAVLFIISLPLPLAKFWLIVYLIIIGITWIILSERCFGWCLTIFEFSLRFGTRILRQLGCVLNQEGDNHDGAEGGGGGGRKTGDQGHSAGSGGDIVSAEEADEHKAERAEGTSSDYENERISSTSNVFRERVITRRKQAMPSDLEKFPAIKDDIISDRKSEATGSNFFGKSLKSLSPGKED